MAMRLRESVAKRQKGNPGRFCVGLDPDISKVPAFIVGPNDGIRAAIYLMGIVDATASFASAFKPQRAYFEALDGGIEGLRMLIAYIHNRYPRIPVILDVKRGDIDRTQARYGIAHFMLDGVDSMNFNPYMGSSTLTALVGADKDGTLITLGRTSNWEAWELQDAVLVDGRRFWEHSLECAYSWAGTAGILDRFGVVMGAAHKTDLLHKWDNTIAQHDFKGPAYAKDIYDWHLSRAREIVGDDTPFLIPGLGTQGGALEQTIRAAYRGPGTTLPSSSSAVCHASAGRDCYRAARDAAKETCIAIARVITSMGVVQ